MVHLWRSENPQSVSALHHTGFWAWTWVIKLYSRSYLTGCQLAINFLVHLPFSSLRAFSSLPQYLLPTGSSKPKLALWVFFPIYLSLEAFSFSCWSNSLEYTAADGFSPNVASTQWISRVTHRSSQNYKQDAFVSWRKGESNTTPYVHVSQHASRSSPEKYRGQVRPFCGRQLQKYRPG